MPNRLRITGRVLACFLLFDVICVVLTLFAEFVAAIDIVWETSPPMYYAVWFVVGVFCALAIYMRSDDRDVTSPAAHRRGTTLVIITGLVAVALGFLSSLVWRGGDFAEPVAPDHAGITITYLVTVTLGVAWARFVLFREPLVASADAAPPPSEDARYQRALKHASIPAKPAETDAAESADFEPAGFLATLGFLLGVPLLLFLDASFFLLGPFDYFDRWTDPILTSALVGGIAWGAASSRWSGPSGWVERG